MRRLVVIAVVVAIVLAGGACGGDGGAVPEGEAGDRTVTGPTQFRYGDDYAQQYGFLTVPAGEGPHPVIVFVHGGFWRNTYDTMLADPQAADAAGRGYATWNIEYRRVGDPDGGYPGTLADVAAAVDHLAALAVDHDLDLERVAVVGHSAGGHLALWVGQRGALPAGSVGAAPLVVPRLVVGQAPVADLADNLDLGGGAVVAFLGGTPEEVPSAYAAADPAALLPIIVPQLIVQGLADTIVPADRATAYAEAVGDPAALTLRTYAGADHFDVIDPAHVSWTDTLVAIDEAFRP